MKKENENIHLHNIKTDYKNLKPPKFNVSEKAELPDQLQRNQAEVMKELGKMHDQFVVVTESGTLEPNQVTPEKPQITDESLSGLTVAELFSSFQNMKAEEQELLDQKQLLLGNLDKLKHLIIEEIDIKHKSIQRLKSEVLELDKTCGKISQALGLSANAT